MIDFGRVPVWRLKSFDRASGDWLTFVNKMAGMCEMGRPRPPNKEVEAAVVDAELRGWVCRPLGHWGRLFCPKADQDGCQIGVFSKPKSADNKVCG